MGTRHLVLVYYKGTYQIAQYGQWDGYPSGQGVIVLEFIRDSANLAKLKQALNTPGRIFEPIKEQLKGWYDEMNAAINAHYQQRGLGDKPVARLPSISRDTGAKILEVVANATEPVPLVKEVEFIADTLFCEWAYVVDLDQDCFEVYAGNRDGDAQTRFGEEEGVKHDGPSLMGRWSLEALPTEDELIKVGELDDDEDGSGQ